jgi:tRNA pseudouridine55 synthase
VDGVLLVDKPSDWTSHDVVARIRGRFRFKKVGHGGTLDPMATGLLVILLGRGTKLSQRVMGSDKTYEGTMELGVTTDTHDADGDELTRADPSGVTREDLERETAKWVGDVMQTPPMVSAIKKDGVPLYKLARKGKSIEREPRFLHIYEFTITSFEPPQAQFRLRCTKGTYVRTLCHDIGQALGCGGFLRALRRTESGPFSVEDALPLSVISDMTVEELQERILPVHQILQQENRSA